MAGGGGFVGEGGGRSYEGRVTIFVLLAAMGGLLFGYDLGISGNWNTISETHKHIN